MKIDRLQLAQGETCPAGSATLLTISTIDLGPLKSPPRLSIVFVLELELDFPRPEWEPSDGTSVNRDFDTTRLFPSADCHSEDEDEDDFPAKEISIIAFLIRVIC